MARVKILGLSKRYDQGAAALEDVDIDIRSGEFIVLVGPSGCGKSTLLRSIAGLESPTSGTIDIGDRVVNDLSPSDRGIAMVFQDYALYPHMTVRQNLAFGLEMKRMRKEEIRDRIDESAKMLGLSELMGRKPAQLSGGQRQRVAIGRALVKHPSVLLLDEPLSNLDARLRTQTRVEIAALHRRIGSTTIYVTHDQEEAMTLADRIVVLDHGKVQQIGSPMELYHNPINRFVASFIGSPSMNFLGGELKKKESGRWFFETSDERIEIKGSNHPPKEGRYALGFRPESIRIVDQGLRAALTWLELHGHEVQAIARLAGQSITIRTSDPEMSRRLQSLSPDASFAVALDPDQLHWFEAARPGRRVLQRKRLSEGAPRFDQRMDEKRKGKPG